MCPGMHPIKVETSLIQRHTIVSFLRYVLLDEVNLALTLTLTSGETTY